jgi:hypothetical protein
MHFKYLLPVLALSACTPTPQGRDKSSASILSDSGAVGKAGESRA